MRSWPGPGRVNKATGSVAYARWPQKQVRFPYYRHGQSLARPPTGTRKRAISLHHLPPLQLSCQNSRTGLWTRVPARHTTVVRQCEPSIITVCCTDTPHICTAFSDWFGPRIALGRRGLIHSTILSTGGPHCQTAFPLCRVFFPNFPPCAEGANAREATAGNQIGENKIKRFRISSLPFCSTTILFTEQVWGVSFFLLFALTFRVFRSSLSVALVACLRIFYLSASTALALVLPILEFSLFFLFFFFDSQPLFSSLHLYQQPWLLCMSLPMLTISLCAHSAPIGTGLLILTRFLSAAFPMRRSRMGRSPASPAVPTTSTASMRRFPSTMFSSTSPSGCGPYVRSLPLPPLPQTSTALPIILTLVSRSLGISGCRTTFSRPAS